MTWRSRAQEVVDLFKQTAAEWIEDDAPQFGAALAYYSVFSLAPMVLLLIAVIGVLFRADPAPAFAAPTLDPTTMPCDRAQRNRKPR